MLQSANNYQTKIRLKKKQENEVPEGKEIALITPDNASFTKDNTPVT